MSDVSSMLKLSIPAEPGLFTPLVQHPKVLRVVALSGGFSRADACRELAKNPGMIVSRLTGAHRPDPAKLSEYECGFPAFEDARAEFDVRFYLVAILFIVFDLEAAFLFPWAVSLDFTRWTGWLAMVAFLIELGLGLAYAWKKGALEWE